MRLNRAAFGSVGILCVLILTSCGGDSGGGGYGGSVPASMATAFSLTNLVADMAGGTAAHDDANLVNPWGLSIPPGKPAWVANNHTETSTLYDGTGVPQPLAAPLVMTFAAGAGGTTFDPTGIVFNGSTTDFIVASGATSGAAVFIFDGEGGMLAGWSPTVSGNQAVTMYTDTGGAVYKGLAVATDNGQAFLYATDFHNNKIDVFDTHFVKQTVSATAFTFSDP
ncbi:MAG: hypothetical protein QOG17_1645, partial [Gammaproteobacteria bacterium]|nr:hypothetical protein [Gammaproteobacteria bacterium]